MLEWNPLVVEETKEQRVWAESQLRLKEPQVIWFGGWREWFLAGILAEEAEEDSSQRWIESMGCCEDFQIRLECHQMYSTSGMWAAEKVMIGLVRTALRGTAATAGLLESELLDLQREYFIDPFRETFLFCEQEGEQS